MSRPIYLDYAAATPMAPKVISAMEPYFSQRFHNPSATYLAARNVRRSLDEARAGVAKWLGTKPAEIIFTAGATEANNLAIAGIMRQFPEGEVLVGAIEHESVLEPAKLFKNRQIPVDKQGILSLAFLKKMITADTVLVSVMLVNNELGVVQPLSKIAALLRAEKQARRKMGNRTPLYLHTDAAQAANYLDLHVSRLGVDMLSLNGGKIYGPKQSGVLFVRTGTQLTPLILGGGQERDLRSGTENVATVVGLAKALDIAQGKRSQEAKRVKALRDLFISSLAAAGTSVQINGSDKQIAPHILNISLPGHDNERLMMELDEKGIQAAVGSACSAANVEPSHVLSAIGLPDELARASLRFSFGRLTTPPDTRRAVQALGQLTKPG